MATTAQMNQLVGNAIFDQGFRSWIFKDPVGAADSLGITLTPEQIEAINNLDQATINALVQLFSKEAMMVNSLSPSGFWLARAQTDTTDM